MRKTLEDRFWSRVDKSGGPDACWLWQGYCGKQGYGRVWAGGRLCLAHRVAMVLSGGRMDFAASDHTRGADLILHKCDNKQCVNPAHLEIGTQAKNIADAFDRGQQQPNCGAMNGNARLTEEQARAIKASPHISGPKLAKRHGVHHRQIYDIRAGKTWKHVKEAA